MGWNSWNQFACDISEVTIKQAADKIVELGLDKLGYNYVNIDDCWMLKERTADGHF
jgi:alpha-galactosidase